MPMLSSQLRGHPKIRPTLRGGVERRNLAGDFVRVHGVGVEAGRPSRIRDVAAAASSSPGRGGW